MNKGHSQTGDHRGKDKSGHRKKATERGALTNWRPQREGQARTRKESDRASHRGALTYWRPQREGQVRTWKESDRARGTHVLETTEGWTSQDTERNQPSEGHSQTEGRRGRDKSGHRKKRVRDRKIRDKEGKTDTILAVTFFQRQVTIQMMILQ